MQTQVQTQIQHELQELHNFIKNLVQTDTFDTLPVLGDGVSATVYAVGDFALKKFEAKYGWQKCLNPNDLVILADIEFEKLKNLEHLDFIPKSYFRFRHVIVMERIWGKTLRKFLDENSDEENRKNINIEQICTSIEDMAKQIIYAGYSPYDIHSENVMVTDDGELKIVDVGNFQKINGNKIDSYCMDDGFDRVISFTKSLKRQFNNGDKKFISI